jgi:membrane protein implicated in regulation of membrane protease activity
MSRRKVIFIVGLVAVQLSLIWPVYPLFSGIYPLIMEIPLSFAWIIFVLFSAFFLLLWYYLSEPKEDEPLKSGPG